MERINRILTWPLLFIVLALALPPAVALAAPDIPTPDTDTAGWVKALYVGVTSKAWGSVCGLVMIGITYPLRRWGGVLVPWFKTPLGGLVLGFLVSLAGTLGVALAAGVQLTSALWATSLSGAAASAGIWEWLKTHIPWVNEAGIKARELPAATSFKSVTLIVIALVALAGCAGTQAKVEAAVPVAKAGLVECAKANAPSLIGLGAELLAIAAASVLGAGDIDWKPITAKAKAEGPVIGGCAFAALYNAFDKAPEPAARSFAATVSPRRAALGELRASFGGTQWKLPDGTVVQ